MPAVERVDVARQAFRAALSAQHFWGLMFERPDWLVAGTSNGLGGNRLARTPWRPTVLGRASRRYFCGLRRARESLHRIAVHVREFRELLIRERHRTISAV